MAVVRCRARVVESCYGLRGMDEEQTEYEFSQREDGTYDPDSDTVVCTPCYVAVGVPTNEDLPAAIAEYRRFYGTPEHPKASQ